MNIPRPVGWLVLGVGLIVTLAAIGNSENPLLPATIFVALLFLAASIMGRDGGSLGQSVAKGASNAARIGASSSTGRRLQRIAGLTLIALALVLMVALLSSTEETNTAEPLALLAILLVLGVVLTRTAGEASRSLRRQLAVLGLTAVLLPMLLLLLTFAAGSEDSEVFFDDQNRQIIEDTNGDIPPEAAMVAVLLSLGAGFALWTWSTRAVQPMAAITDVANEIQAGSLNRRIGLEGAPVEVQALADSFDRMLDRLSTASESQQQLIENASHELRTPLAALAVNNEVILSNTSPTLDDYQASAKRSETLILRLQSTLDDLLVDARSRTETTRQVDNDLMAIVHRVALQQRILQPGVPVVVRGPKQLLLGIDGPSVERALTNLVENAARYSPPSVPISIDVAQNDGPLDDVVTLSVTDHGPGIPVSERDTVFDRYYQSDGTAESGTAGIGLALVKQVAEAHGGIEVVSPLPGDTLGTRFTLTFVAIPHT